MATQDVTEAKGTKSKAFTQSRLGRAFSPSYRFDHRFDDIHLRPEAGTRFEGRTPTANIISRDQAKKAGTAAALFNPRYSTVNVEPESGSQEATDNPIPGFAFSNG